MAERVGFFTDTRVCIRSLAGVLLIALGASAQVKPRVEPADMFVGKWKGTATVEDTQVDVEVEFTKDGKYFFTILGNTLSHRYRVLGATQIEFSARLPDGKGPVTWTEKVRVTKKTLELGQSKHGLRCERVK